MRAKAFDVDNPYFRTKVLTAGPGELRMMLLEGAVRFMAQGREGLVERDYERVYEGFSQARAIVLELINGMDRAADPALCDRLNGLYTYIHRLLMEASFEKSLEKADEAIRLMEYERETWVMVLEKLKREQGEGGESAVGGAAGGEGASLSVEG